MSFARLWQFLAVALPVLAALIAPMSTVDLAYHLRAGSEILATRAIPTVDTWTYTIAGQPWFDQQWGSQVVLALVERLGGWTALAIFRAALVGGLVTGLLVIARRRRLASRTAALLVLAAFIVMAPALALRPQLLGMGCFVLLLLIVTDRRDHPGRLWLAVPLVIVWANLHGSFFLGPVALGLALLEDLNDHDPRARRTLIVASASALAACVTPFGPLVWAYAVGLSANPEVTSRVSEWQPTSLREVPGLLFFASVAGVVVLLARRGGPTSWPTLAWLAVFILIGLYAQRGLAWWPMAAVPALAGTLIPVRRDRTSGDAPVVRRVNVGVLVAMVVAIVAALPGWRPLDPDTRAPAGLLVHAPSGITGALSEVVRSGDRVLAPQLWSSWLEYAFPDALQAVDARVEIFPPGVWDDYETILTGQAGWEDRLAAWDVTVIVTAADSVATRDRLIERGWVMSYADEDGAVLTSPDR